MEKEQTITSMQKQIEDLKRRAEQGAQQLQGEVQALAIEALLGARFPHDTLEPVPKGEHGGDVLQRVMGPLQQACGTIPTSAHDPGRPCTAETTMAPHGGEEAGPVGSLKGNA
jgi:hypothetical protein